MNMYKHILIPTDGSPLSEEAVRQGMALAKSLGAKTTVITVSPKFHTLAVEPGMVIATPKEYERECEAVAAKVLGTAEGVASESSVARVGASRSRSPLRATSLCKPDFWYAHNGPRNNRSRRGYGNTAKMAARNARSQAPRGCRRSTCARVSSIRAS